MSPEQKLNDDVYQQSIRLGLRNEIRHMTNESSIRFLQVNEGYEPCFGRYPPYRPKHNDPKRCDQFRCLWLPECDSIRMRKTAIKTLLNRDPNVNKEIKEFENPFIKNIDFDKDLTGNEDFLRETLCSELEALDWEDYSCAYLVEPANSLEVALSIINESIIYSISRNHVPKGISEILEPVALFFLRGDREGPGKDIAKQVMASYEYWNRDSGEQLCILLPGWSDITDNSILDNFNNNPIFTYQKPFNVHNFLEFRYQIERMSKWEYSGETDILLLNYVFNIDSNHGDFDFSQTILLQPEKLLRKELIGSIDSLIQNLINAAKTTQGKGVWDISDNIGLHVIKRSLWDYLKKVLLGEAAKIYDEMRPFAVCNLEK